MKIFVNYSMKIKQYHSDVAVNKPEVQYITLIPSIY